VGNADPSRLLRQRLPAVSASLPKIRALTVDFVTAHCNAAEAPMSDIALCVTEAAANAVQHAYDQPGGDITLTVQHTNGKITVEICDEGIGTQAPSPNPGLGLGLKIVHTLSDATSAPSNGSGLRVTMRFPCPSK
jgi:anti-sigma regulatory factor (Ser/Thr protein kinase)